MLKNELFLQSHIITLVRLGTKAWRTLQSKKSKPQKKGKKKKSHLCLKCCPRRHRAFSTPHCAMQAVLWKADLQTGGFTLMAVETSEVPWDAAGSPSQVGFSLPVGSESTVLQGCPATDPVENNKGKRKMLFIK